MEETITYDKLASELETYSNDQLIAGLALLLLNRMELKDQLKRNPNDLVALSELQLNYEDSNIYKRLLQERNYIKFTHTT